jgi:drug/metabolite transporter (DMT)-like permease
MAVALAGSGWPELDFRPAYWLAVVYLALFGSAITFPLYLYVMRAIGPARAAYSSVMVPIVAMGFSTLLEDYRWTPVAAAGAVLALGGMLFALRGKAATG